MLRGERNEHVALARGLLAGVPKPSQEMTFLRQRIYVRHVFGPRCERECDGEQYQTGR
jgi:hypothetical protein